MPSVSWWPSGSFAYRVNLHEVGSGDPGSDPEPSAASAECQEAARSNVKDTSSWEQLKALRPPTVHVVAWFESCVLGHAGGEWP